MPADDPRDPYTIPEPPRRAEPDTTPAAGEHGTPSGADATGPHEPSPTGTVVQPGMPAVLRDPSWPEVPGYEVTGEIARGGMGVVYAALDLTLGREVAVKTVLPKLAGEPRFATEFDREAKLTALLSHPGVPPVHALGALADGRPFLAMRLIRGRTLSDELRAADLSSDRARLVGVFEQVCQTVGYAHSIGIVHRDLKPGNVMVGAFGEVQVMDWGLAKVLADPAGGRRVADLPAPEVGATAAGRAKGSPPYMAPEQARGEWARVDVRADVFALGGILCAALTGDPPYSGRSVGEVLRRAADGDVADALARLDRCGADAELVGLCRRCLSPDPADRPADGRAVAEGVAAYRAGVEERAQKAEAERAAAEVRAAEQRRKRRWQIAAVAAAGLLVAGAAGAGWWWDREAAERRAETLRQQAEGERRVGRNVQALADLVDRCEAALRRSGPGDAARADGLLREVDRRLPEGGGDDLRARVDRCRADLALARDLDRVDVLRWTRDGQGRRDEADLVRRRAEVLARAGVRPGEVPPTDGAALVAGSLLRDRLVAALDQWLGADPSAGVRDLLRAVDPDPYRERVREATLAGDAGRVADLARQAGADRPQQPGFAVALGRNPTIPADVRRAVLRTALLDRPNDPDLLMSLGRTYRDARDPGEEARWYQAAVAADPDLPTALYNLGRTLDRAKRTDEAITYFRAALRRDSEFGWAHTNLGLALLDKKDPAAALHHLREGVRLEPGSADAHFNLGVGLADGGASDAALAEFRQAVQLDPGHAQAHNRIAFHLIPKGQLDEALDHARKSSQLDPGFHYPRMNVGWALRLKGDLDGSLAAYREAAQVGPTDPWAHYNLGTAFGLKKDADGALAAYREAVRLDPDFPEAHCNLGLALMRGGRPADGLPVLRRGHELGSKRPGWQYPSVKWVEMCEGAVAKQQERIAPPPREKP